MNKNRKGKVDLFCLSFICVLGACFFVVYFLLIDDRKTKLLSKRNFISKKDEKESLSFKRDKESFSSHEKEKAFLSKGDNKAFFFEREKRKEND